MLGFISSFIKRGLWGPTLAPVQAAYTGNVNTQTGGTAQLASEVNVVTYTVTTGLGATLPVPTSSTGGDTILVVNVSAVAGTLFPPVGGKINGLSANASYAHAANKTAICVSINALDWAVAIA